MSLADYGENAALNAILASWSATLYVALLTQEPVDGDTPTTMAEITGGGYARVAAPNWGAASQGRISTDAVVYFPEATAPWPTVRYFALVTAATGGSLYGWGRLTTPRTIQTGQVPRIPMGSLAITAD